MRQPDTILKDQPTLSMFDFTKPIALIWGSMLHFIEDRDDPFGILARYKELLKPGDYIALSHLTWQFFDGTELVDPGLVPLPDWQPDAPNTGADPFDQARAMLIGVGRLAY